ncbi:MAG: FHA domain-containing protein, partial [Elusimicrobiota bacterium]
VGRAPRADFVVDAPLVSRLHCRLTLQPDGLLVEDLESTNGTLVNQDFGVFGAGASIFGTITIAATPLPPAGSAVYVNAWSPGSFNYGSTVTYTSAGGTAGYAMPGLDGNATYQMFINVQSNGGKSDYDVPGGFPLKVFASAAPQNFTLSQASGVVMGTIFLQAGASDFLNVELYGRTLASLRPNDVGRTFVDISTSLPGFSCGGLPASSASSAPVAGYCPNTMSSATFLVPNVNTETLELSFLHKTTGQSTKQILSAVNGATVTLVSDLSGVTYSISGTITNQITAALFNTNQNIVENAPYIAPVGYPAGLSSTTARVTAIRQDIDAYGVAISTVFSPLTSRVGFMAASGTFTITNVPKGNYFVRTAPLRACTTCPVLVPSVGRVVSVTGASVSSVTLTLSDGYTVSGSISLDGGILDSRIFDVTVVNRRQEVVSSTVVYLGDVNQGVTANAVDYAFTNLPAGEFYTLTVRGRLFPIKYTGRPIKFPDAALSPNGLQSNLSAQNVLLQRAAYIVGRLKDAGTGEIIRAGNATLLAPNFAIKATANPWIEGGYVTAASSISARPIEGDGYFRVGPLVPDISYDLRLAQATWDPNFLASGSQNYAPVTISGLKPTPGEIRDVGVVALGQGLSFTGVVRSTATGLTLGNIKVTARPSFGGDDLVVQSFTNQQGVYSLWMSTAVSNQFNLVVAPRDGNQASDGKYYAQSGLTNINLQTQTSANFLLTPLSVVVTGFVSVPTGEQLSYPFGEKRGFPAAAINLKLSGTVSDNPLGDIEAVTDQSGFFSVPGLSTGIYTLHATSLGYSVFNATVQVIGSTYHIFTGANLPANDLPGNTLSLVRGASVTGRILKSDGTSPNSSEVVGVAAANFGAGEFVVGSVETDAVAKTVSAYTISGFKTGISDNIVLLSGSNGKEVSFPPEGSGILFTAAESSTTKTISLTYRPAALDCLASARALDAARTQFSVKVSCLKPLRQESAAPVCV